jgi:predicted PurR-regulated permease PerM
LNDRLERAPDSMPDADDLPGKGTAVGIGVLAFVAATGALFFARQFFVPIAFAFTLHPLFRPLVRRLERLRLPTPVAAGVVVLGLVAVLVGGAYGLSVPMKGWIANAPASFDAAERKLSRLREPVKQVTAVADRIQHAADMGSTAPATQGAATQPSGQGQSAPSQSSADGSSKESAPQLVSPQAPAPAAPGFLGRFLGTTTTLLGGITEVLVLLLLLLASGDLFFDKLLKVMPTRQDKREAAEVVEEARRAVSRYVAVTALINLGQAVVVALVLWWLKMPNFWLWALACFVLEFIPYLGATIMILLLSVVAFATFDGMGHTLAVPLSYLVITTVQNNVVSPYLYGDHLKLNPVAVLIGVLFWWFVWGTGGAFLAVPIIATVRIVTKHTRSFHALAEFLGE